MYHSSVLLKNLKCNPCTFQKENIIIEFELNTDWSLLGLFSEANLFPKVVCLFFILQEDG